MKKIDQINYVLIKIQTKKKFVDKLRKEIYTIFNSNLLINTIDIENVKENKFTLNYL